MKNNDKKAVIICRVSSKEQEDSGYSLEAQEKLLQEYANKNVFKVIKVFKISESASGKMVRKKFNEVLIFVKKNNINLILCEKTDRLTRNMKDAVIISDWVSEDPNHEVHFAKENFIANQNTKAHENLVWDMKISISKFYSNNLSEEVKKGQKEKIAQGWLPSRPPIGYKTIGEKGHKTHVIDKETAPHLTKMFELYATGNYSIIRLEEELYKDGLRSVNGNKILQSRIYDLLQDPFYCGKIRWNEEIYPAKQEALITKDLFDKVQTILKRRGKNPVVTKHNYLFQGKIFCEGCGGVLSWETQKGILYGHCNNHLRSKNCTKKTYIKEKEVEEQIVSIFDKIAPRNEAVLKWIEEIIKEENNEQVKFRETEVQKLNGRLLSIRKEKDKYFEAKIGKVVDLDYCEKKIAECKAEESALESALERISDKSDEYQELRLIIHELAYRAKEIYSKATVEDKKLLFSQLFTNFSQNRYEISAKYNLACDYLLEWTPKLNELYELQKSQFNALKTSSFVKSDYECSTLLRG